MLKHLYYIILLAFIGCNDSGNRKYISISDSVSKGSFGYDLAFLKKHNKRIITLERTAGDAKLLISADYQGRVMTSTATGDTGTSFGWINYNLLASGKKNKQFNPVGGEERFWLGPEGGQYALYFKGGDSFNINHWQVPAFIDSDSFEVKETAQNHVTFSKQTSISNYAGTVFDISIQRTISLFDKKQLEEKLKTKIPEDLHFVAYESVNRLTNSGKEDWKQERGLLSIWLLGMFTPSDQTKVIIPFHQSENAGSLITSNYFGDIAAGRLQVKDSVLFFTCDGKYRSKIGLSPLIAKPVAGSFDFSKNILTLIVFSVEKNGAYVNSKWELQKEPFKGDVVNAYNDGPMSDGSQLGPFYELESSSPSTELKKGGSLEYRQVTCHIQGKYKSLQTIAQQVLGINLDAVRK